LNNVVSLAGVKRGVSTVAPRIVLYSSHGVGKTTWAASAPNPIFLQAEDGLGVIEDAATFGLLRHYDQFMSAIGELLEGDHDFKTVVVDSLDHLEPMVWAKVCELNNWSSIEDPGYGKGYTAALERWRELLDGMNALRDEKGMTVIYLAHATVKRFDSPETEPYDRYQIKLHEKTSALVQEAADCVFFANFRVSIEKTDVGFKKTVSRGKSGGQRLLYTEERPAFMAKNRYKMPESIPMPEENGFAVFADYVPFYHLGAGNNADSANQ